MGFYKNTEILILQKFGQQGKIRHQDNVENKLLMGTKKMWLNIWKYLQFEGELCSRLKSPPLTN
jgi:hypothetical protein